MVSPEFLRTTALSFAETCELPHFEKTSFRVGKKIFATFDAKTNICCVKLSPTDQHVFSSYDNTLFMPLTNKWGDMGWTNIDMEKVEKEMFTDLLTLAYNEVCAKRLRIRIEE